MSKRRPVLTLFDRLRRGSGLRVLFAMAALLASQNSLACALEEAFAPQTEVVEVGVAASADTPSDNCCGVCFDCAQCGCCGIALNARAGGDRHADLSIADGRQSLHTAAPRHWTPPTLLKPPISLG